MGRSPGSENVGSHYSGATAWGFHPLPYSPRTSEAPKRLQGKEQIESYRRGGHYHAF